MTPSHETCPDCGHAETVEVNRAYVEGFLSEADYQCAGCTRHRGSFSYGAWLPGTGEPAALAELRAIDAELTRAGDTGPDATARLVLELRRATGQPLIVCRKAYLTAGGDFAKASELLASRISGHGLLIDYARQSA